MSAGRLGALADGVFAIVMTLLVFDFRVSADAPSLADALAALLPNLTAYVISFVILGVYWVGHHFQFTYIERTDHWLNWLNIAFLLCVALVPFSAGVLSRYGSERLAIIVYGVNLILVAITHMATWQYASRQQGLIRADTPQELIDGAWQLSAAPLIAYLAAIGVSFVSPALAVAVYAIVPIPYVTGLIYRVAGRR